MTRFLDSNAEVWNQQLFPIIWSQWNASGCTAAFQNNEATIVASQKDGYLYAYEQFPIQPGHIYLCSYSIKLTTPTTDIKMNTMGGAVQIHPQATTEWQTLYRFYRYNGTSSFGVITSIQDNRLSGWDAIKVKNIMIFDLTFMLGSPVSNYIYSLEYNEAMAGYNLFKIIYPLQYYTRNLRKNYPDD